MDLNHTIVPAHGKVEAALWFARIFGLTVEEPVGHFAAVRVNGSLTLLFDDQEEFGWHHYAFHVSDKEFDAVFGRIKEDGIAYGSGPGHFDNRQLNDWGGGRGVYFKSPDGHVLELMTVPQ